MPKLQVWALCPRPWSARRAASSSALAGSYRLLPGAVGLSDAERKQGSSWLIRVIKESRTRRPA